MMRASAVEMMVRTPRKRRSWSQTAKFPLSQRPGREEQRRGDEEDERALGKRQG